VRIETWQWVILLVIVLLFWGAPKLPGLAKSMAQSLQIFRTEIKTQPKPTAEAESGSEAAEDSEKKKD
jgi:sec-independent protein translocase protein TatA